MTTGAISQATCRRGAVPRCGCGTALGQAAPPDTTAIPNRPHLRLARRWFRRPIVLVSLGVLLLLVGMVGFLLIQAGSTVVTLRQISTPPAALSGAALGGKPETMIDTSAARVSADSSDDDRGWWNRARGVAAGAADVTEGAVVAVGIKDEPPPRTMTILLMGVDARPDEEIDVGVRPDALAVLHLNAETGSCRLLAIPRDSRVELPGYGLTKVNHALAVGGIPYQRQVVEQFLGITLDHYGLIDFGGLTTLVDAVGGVTISVPEAFTSRGVTFAAGEQTLDGTQALEYARYRGGPDGDFGRIRRQQQVIVALIEAAAGRNPLRDVNEVLPALRDHIRTDLTPVDLMGIALRYRETCTDQTISMGMLDGTVATFHDPLLHMDLSYVVVDEAEVRRKVAALLDE
ncbi:MAG: LCP family protein [Thermomicrobiales bacterium]